MSRGFDPALRLIDLANLFRLTPQADIAAVIDLLTRHGESSTDLAGLTDTDVAELRDATLRFAPILTASDPDDAAPALNRVLSQSGAMPRLSNHGGHFWHLHVDHEDSGWGDWLASSGALALAQLLSERGRIAWGACAAPGCGRFFLDTGPGSARRYCSTTCATRARVAEHRAKKAGRL